LSQLEPLLEKVRNNKGFIKRRKKGDPEGLNDSPFLLALIDEDFSDSTFKNKSKKIRQMVNRNLRPISEKLGLLGPLNSYRTLFM